MSAVTYDMLYRHFPWAIANHLPVQLDEGAFMPERAHNTDGFTFANRCISFAFAWHRDTNWHTYSAPARNSGNAQKQVRAEHQVRHNQ